MDRRQFMTKTITVPAGLWLWNREALSSTCTPGPNFSSGSTIKFVSGLRPGRHHSVRIEPENFGNKLLVHNYGHSGAGITTAWGSAYETADLLAAYSDKRQVAVLGGGVIGMTAAHVLKTRGYEVSLWAKELTPHTTSDVAGGQFAPSGIRFANMDLEKRILRRSYQAYRELLGRNYGVFERDNYTLDDAGHRSLEKIPRDLVPRWDLEQLPFCRVTVPGRKYRTLLIEPPIFLPRLLSDLRDIGVAINDGITFGSVRDVCELNAPLIVNALGLGAGRVMDDPEVYPIRGQLVHLTSQRLPYLLTHHGYIFPRRDAVVLGGTWEPDEWTNVPKISDCKAIFSGNRSFFEGQPNIANFRSLAERGLLHEL